MRQWVCVLVQLQEHVYKYEVKQNNVEATQSFAVCLESYSDAADLKRLLYSRRK